MARYGYSRKSTRNADKLFSSLFKVGASMASAYAKEAKRQQREQARQVAAYNRFLEQQEREELRQIKQHEMAMRRAEREREKAERERERAARLQAKLEEQKRVEDEIEEIEDNNFLWGNVHSFINQIVTLEDANDVIAKCDFEQKNNVKDGYFKTPYPQDTLIKHKVSLEADKKFDIQKAQEDYFLANKQWDDFKFREVEPTIESVTDELVAEAKENISAFFPWKQSKLRRAYVDNHLNDRYEEQHNAWQLLKKEFESKKAELKAITDKKEESVNEIRKSKKDYIANRISELYAVDIKKWEDERDEFYDSLRQSMRNLIDGDKDYVLPAISSLFPDDELPMEYFVDFTYEEEIGKVMVDLDLPEIEDLPERKIILTPTGKKSIRMKTQTDLRIDYANCVCGLAMYVASSIFNISLKVKEIEISAFTQRKEANSALATDQYIFVVDFKRDLFSIIEFDRLSALQVMDFFPHYYNMTKSYDMKQIDLSNAYAQMESFVIADYRTVISTLPPRVEKPSKPASVNNNVSDSNSDIFGGDNSDSDEVDMTHLDPLFEDAARIIVMNQSGSTSLIQRKFAIGYNRAGRLMDQLEKAGIVGAAKGSAPREILIHDEYSLNKTLASLR